MKAKTNANEDEQEIMKQQQTARIEADNASWKRHEKRTLRDRRLFELPASSSSIQAVPPNNGEPQTTPDTGDTFTTAPDDQFTQRNERIGFYGSLEEGRVCIDARAIVGLVV